YRFIQNMSRLRLPRAATGEQHQTEQLRQGNNPAPAISPHCVIPPLGTDHLVASAKMTTTKPHAAGNHSPAARLKSAETFSQNAGISVKQNRAVPRSLRFVHRRQT